MSRNRRAGLVILLLSIPSFPAILINTVTGHLLHNSYVAVGNGPCSVCVIRARLIARSDTTPPRRRRHRWLARSAHRPVRDVRRRWLPPRRPSREGP